MPRMTGGQALVEILAAHGVETVFGMPGSHSLAIYDALAAGSAIRHISIRHEQGAAFMADGYARSTGKVGVCITTTGPAALNTLGALSTSYTDSCPVMLLCTQVPRDYIGKDKGIYHEIPDQLGMLERITKFAARPNNPQEIVDLVREAYRQALDGRPRPVALELPADILNEEGDVTILAPAPLSPKQPTSEDIEAARRLIVDAKRPVVWVGGGVVSSGASAELAQFVELIQAPVLSTTLAKGALPGDHPLELGFLAVKQPVQEYLATCDLVIAIGTRFSYISTERWTIPLPKRMIHIDIDESVIGRNYPVTLGVAADARESLRALVGQLRDAQGSAPRESRTDEVRELKDAVHADWKQEIPRDYRILQRIREVLPRNAIISGDPTMCMYLAWRMLDAYEPRGFLYPMACATLGYGYPAALGAKLAHPDRPVVAICGDGGFMLSCQEMATAAQYGINVVVLLFNDDGFEVLRIQQDDRFGRRSEVDLKNPDFVAMAQSFGVDGVRVDDVDRLGAVIETALGNNRPTLIEIPLAIGADTITA